MSTISIKAKNANISQSLGDVIIEIESYDLVEIDGGIYNGKALLNEIPTSVLQNELDMRCRVSIPEISDFEIGDIVKFLEGQGYSVFHTGVIDSLRGLILEGIDEIESSKL